MKRLDLYLVDKLKNISRTKAQDLIRNGSVEVLLNSKWQLIKQPSFEIEELSQPELRMSQFDELSFVSRSGLKLKNALTHTNLQVRDLKALDIGQSTGGFTDCLLQNDISEVVGVEVGSGQIHEKIKGHPKVVLFEKTNAKELYKNSEFVKLYPKSYFDIVVCDVSFISFTSMVQSINFLLKEEGIGLCLIKPQFEVGPQNLGKDGVVKNPKLYDEVQIKIETELKNYHFELLEYFAAKPTGKDGNIEFFVHFRKCV